MQVRSIGAGRISCCRVRCTSAACAPGGHVLAACLYPPDHKAQGSMPAPLALGMPSAPDFQYLVISLSQICTLPRLSNTSNEFPLPKAMIACAFCVCLIHMQLIQHILWSYWTQLLSSLLYAVLHGAWRHPGAILIAGRAETAAGQTAETHTRAGCGMEEA